MADSAELEVLIKHTRDLELALSNNYGLIIEDLNLAGLVKSDVYDEAKDPQSHLSPKHKANAIVRSVKDMVEIDRSNYHKFLDILKKKRMHYKSILEKIKGTYDGKRNQLDNMHDTTN